MRIITWNVNALRTVLPYRPWNELSNKSIGGMLDAMDAEIICFQEHKGRRDNMDKPTAVPPNFDAFFSFPHGKGGYSGTCTYVRSSYAVPLKAEEGITGKLLKTPGGNSAVNKLVYTGEETIGGYVGEAEVEVRDNTDGTVFDVKKLDMEGRAVVLDFGFFVIFNLYCPNETNDTRLPYKLNFLHHLEARVTSLLKQGRNVIVLGDINVCHKPLDNGEGGIQRNAEEHFNHPARKWFDKWVVPAPGGVMHDVTREAWPERKGMFTCWNTKLDARPSNYGARIDYILVSEGLLPWIKHSDIQADVMGSDHCPVYVDLHESIVDPEGETLHLRDLMNTGSRVPLPPHLETLREETREAPEPPPFATKWWDEFSGKQRSLMSFFGKKADGPVASSSTPTASQAKKAEPRKRERSVSINGQAGPFATASTTAAKVEEATPGLLPPIMIPATNSVPLTIDSDIDASVASSSRKAAEEQLIEVGSSPIEASPVYKRKKTSPIAPTQSSKGSQGPKTSKNKQKDNDPSGQTKLSSFFRQPSASPSSSSVKPARKSHNRSDSRSSAGIRTDHDPIEIDDDADAEVEHVRTGSTTKSSVEMDDEALATSMAREEEALMQGNGENKVLTEQEQADVVKSWGSIFAKKVPPKCIVHDVPCKSFVSKVPGSKGKKFWLCSKPVGEGWDNGRSKRPRNEVNHQYRCDFFIWDSAVKQKESLVEESTSVSPERPKKKVKTS